jgi:hypothetical protein
MSVSLATRRPPVVPGLFILGVILLGGGLIAASIVQSLVTTLQLTGGPMQTLPVLAYTGYAFPPADHHALYNILLVVFFCVAGVGILVLATAVVLRARRNLAVWLLVLGALVVIGGATAGLIAKRSADVAAAVASSPARLLTMTDELSLNFDPSSAHHVQPDYTGFWVGMCVVAVGVLTVIVGIANKRRQVD